MERASGFGLRAKFLVFTGLLIAGPLVAQTTSYRVTDGNGTTVTVTPLVPTLHPHGSRSVPDADARTAPAPPAPPAQATALDRLEAGFYGGTISAAVAARMVDKIPEAGGFDFIDKHGYDPSAFTNAGSRAPFAQAIAAIEFDRRREVLVEAINATIDEQNAAARSTPPAPKRTRPTPEPQATAPAYDWNRQMTRNLAAESAAPQPQATAPAGDWNRQTAMEDSKRRARLLYPDLKDPNSVLSAKWTEVYEEMKSGGTLPDSTDLPFLISVRAANLLHIMPRAGQ